MPLLPAEIIKHDADFAPAVAQERSAEYGQYLTSITACTMCHGSDYKGAPPIEPGAESGPDIIPDGELKGVSEQAFIDLFRAHAEEEEEEYMPWEIFNNMTVEELGSIWLYLQTFGGS